MKVFKNGIGEHLSPKSERNIRVLGALRGATCGCDYAESFVLLKELS